MESESTDILWRQWAQIEQVFHGENTGVPEGMSEPIYEEVMLWREAFKSKSNRNRNFLRSANLPTRYARNAVMTELGLNNCFA